MKQSTHTEEQMVYALRQAELGTPVADLCRKVGINEQTFYRWKKKFAAYGGKFWSNSFQALITPFG